MTVPSAHSLFRLGCFSCPVLTALALSVLQPQHAAAATITFNDLFETPFVSVNGGLGDPRVTFPTNPTTGCVLEVCTVFLATPASYVQGSGVLNFGNANIFGGSDDSSALSDTYLMTGVFTNNFSVLTGFTLVFTSDSEVQPPTITLIPNARSLVENGGVQSLDQLGWGTTGISDQINFASDTVPEPGSFVLLGLGLVGLGSWQRRRRTRDRCLRC